MRIKEYFNFEYLVKGFYSIAKGMSTLDPFPSIKNYNNFIRNREGDIKRDINKDFKKDREAIKKDWERICKDLGSLVSDNY